MLKINAKKIAFRPVYLRHCCLSLVVLTQSWALQGEGLFLQVWAASPHPPVVLGVGAYRKNILDTEKFSGIVGRQLRFSAQQSSQES